MDRRNSSSDNELPARHIGLMTRLFGYLFSGSTPEAARDYATFASSQGASDPLLLEAGSAVGCGLGQVLVRHGDVLVALTGRARFGEIPIAAEDTDQIAVLVDAFRQNPVGLAGKLNGPFAIAIVDLAERSALLAVDRMGIERVTYAAQQDGIVFSSSASAIARFPGRDHPLRDQALYDFLFMHMIASPNTVFGGVRKLPPATLLLYRNGETNVHRYWEPEYDYAATGEFSALKRSLFEALQTAVWDSEIDDASGAFLSGGLDSSSITGVLASLTDSPAKTFTVGFGVTEYDELEFARKANEHFHCDPHEYHMTPADIVDAFGHIAAAYDEPFGNSSAAPTYFCAKLAADSGVTHLLAGDGGDELFGGNERYAKQTVFDAYTHLPELLTSRLLKPLAKKIGTEHRLMPLRKFASYVEQASIPLPDRFENWNVIYREGRPRLLDESFADAVDLEAPLQLMRDVWNSAPTRNLLEQMLWYDWKFTLADNDLRKVGTMCELAGVRVSYPMLHKDVINLSTRIPPSLKMKRLELRTFFRRCMHGFLPDEILTKSKHGFGLPFGQWLKTDSRLGDLIYSLLSDLKKRRIVSPRFLTELIDDHRAGHASYYGYAIWDLAMLEAWLEHHVDAETGGRA